MRIIQRSRGCLSVIATVTAACTTSRDRGDSKYRVRTQTRVVGRGRRSAARSIAVSINEAQSVTWKGLPGDWRWRSSRGHASRHHARDIQM